MTDAPLNPPAVVLLSGGLDSATTLAMARQQGFAVHALTVRYGQRHAHELHCAAAQAAALGAAQHVVIDLDLARFGGSALTDPALAVPKTSNTSFIQAAASIPITYVPARNTIFLSLALAWAETLMARDVFIGVNAVDYSGYPDCRPEFIEAFESLANLATRAGVEARAMAGSGNQSARGFMIHAPLLRLSKAQIIERGEALGVDFSRTTSCYDPGPSPDHAACGRCEACRLRLAGFADAGRPDPARYAHTPDTAPNR